MLLEMLRTEITRTRVANENVGSLIFTLSLELYFVRHSRRTYALYRQEFWNRGEKSRRTFQRDFPYIPLKFL